MSKVVIERGTLEELVGKGIEKYFIEKKSYGHANFTNCIMREIDTYLAFENENDDFMGEIIKKEAQ